MLNTDNNYIHWPASNEQSMRVGANSDPK